ncbi:7-deoxyloganetin glucosyltransferase-like [Iris pallida]|uniref:Glycosyltransferase n=1 Tax=Iris pallida TaxID=29817 RepID=A0AAX6FFU1_IRIPA|nr:7-deoxyloganetin glucosyltransferase-like [Iris pallida]
MEPLAGEQKPHAVCLSLPLQSHINPMLNLAKLLHFEGFYITFIHTEVNYNRIIKSRGPSSLDGLDGFRFEKIPEPPIDNSTAGQDARAYCNTLRNKFSTPFRNLLKRLNEGSPSRPPVTCIISGAGTSFTLDIAAEFGIPAVIFYTASACGSMAILQSEQLIERGLIPLKSEGHLSNGYLDTPIDWIPGMKKMRLRDLPKFILTTDMDDISLNFAKDELRESSRARAIILNTFDELESSVLNAMSKMLPPIYTIPLTLLCRKMLNSPLASVGSNIWKEDSSCFEWLKEKNPRSVMYVNFGSLAVITREQLMEFAWGLANSGQDFLWIIRPDLLKDDNAILPEDFYNKTNGKGLLMSWCCQEEVLFHPSIRGFLTHCGWNSMMESITAGVPMICWPIIAEQPINCRYACKDWGIGMEIDGEVKREEVEKLIRELMNGEKGEEMRRKAMEWKESAARAGEPGGKYSLNLERVIEDVLLQRIISLDNE